MKRACVLRDYAHMVCNREWENFMLDGCLLVQAMHAWFASENGKNVMLAGCLLVHAMHAWFASENGKMLCLMVVCWYMPCTH